MVHVAIGPFITRHGAEDLPKTARSPVLSYLTLAAVTLIFGLSFAHVMEFPGKLQLDGPAWLTVQQHLYVGFGPLAAVVEPLAIILSWLLVLRRRGHRQAFRLTTIAAAAQTIGLALWAAVVAPMNARLNGWTPATLPTDWTACRNQWELGHALHAALFALAFGCLLWVLVADPGDAVGLSDRKGN